MNSKLRGAILTSLIVQGLGTFAPFLTIVVLARIAGPEVQSIYSKFKVWSDLVSALITFGFPQAFVYLIQAKNVNRYDILNFSRIYTILSILPVFLLSILSVKSGYNYIPDGVNYILYSSCITFGICSICFNRLVRAIYLTIDDGFIFSIITSAPSVIVLISMLFAATLDVFRYDFAFFFVGILTLLVTNVWVRRIVKRDRPAVFRVVPIIPKKLLFNQAMNSFLQSLFFLLQPVVGIYILIHTDGNDLDIAYFSSSIIIISAINSIFGMISPILFNRFSGNINRDIFYNLFRFFIRITIVIALLAVLSIPVYSYAVPAIFGSEYAGAIAAFQVLSCALGPVAFTRMVYPAIHAAGNPGRNTVSCGLRLIVSVATQVGLTVSGLLAPVMAAVCAWVVAEWFSALYSILSARQMIRQWERL